MGKCTFVFQFDSFKIKDQSLKVNKVKEISGAYLHPLNVTSLKEQLRSCSKFNQTGRLKTALDADAVTFVIAK